MEVLDKEEKKGHTKGMSRKKSSKKRIISEITDRERINTGNQLLLAVIQELKNSEYPVSFVNKLKGEKWVATIELTGQVWTDTGTLKFQDEG